ncbi:MAG TPA: oligoendopeptidase F [Chloroflexia bacterium]|nr:oligoendopeptidase F [Chloroflexia bacterium]
MNTTLPARSEIAEEHTWDLTPIYATNDAWEQEFAAISPLLDELETYSGRLGSDPATLLAAMALDDQIGERLGRLVVYAFLRRDEDTSNATYQAFADRAQQLATRAAGASSFMRPELLALRDRTLEQFMVDEPGLRLYEHVFNDLLREKPHVLSEAEETLLAGTGELAAAPGTIFNVLNNADLSFGSVTTEEGEEVPLTHGRYYRFVRSPHRPLRAEAFTKMHGAFATHRNTCAAIFGAQVKKNLFYARARKYPSALEAALHGDNIPATVYTNLIDTVHDHLGGLQEYFTLRQRVLGLDRVHMYDIHVPLVAEAETDVPYEEAVQTVLAAMAPLGEEYTAAAAEGFRSRWVDVYETPNKRSGAYSWGTYGTPPYMLLNYQATLDDVFTLGHELGHAMHSYFTRRTQPYVYSSYTIFVAEVASTLNEALLTHYLLEHTSDPQVRLSVINHRVHTIQGTLYRQTMLAEFEKLAHEAAEAGEALTADRLSEIYYGLNQLYYGPAVVSDEQIAIEWARIPHFYSSFYVYKYSTGIAAATALAESIIREGAPAVERYRHFLTRGSSAYSIDLLRDAGVDMTSPAPIAQTLDVFRESVAEMERLLSASGNLAAAPAGG